MPAASAPSGTTVAGHLSAMTPGHVQFLQGGHSIKSTKMNFTLRILNEDFSVMAEPSTYTPGSPIYVEAKVESSAGVSPRIYVEECYGSHAKDLSRSRRIYVIVNNHGCLHGGKSGNVAVWRRPEDSALQFAIPAFMLADEPEEKIYIHCLLTAWGQESLTNLGKKSCYYNSTSFRSAQPFSALLGAITKAAHNTGTSGALQYKEQLAGLLQQQCLGRACSHLNTNETPLQSTCQTVPGEALWTMLGGRAYG
ncbi:zona pellucida sperm-binding protein 3-like [Gopherus flavomarginatus]|uniref:zona pellucida sperm-binding protein 3-like n=1 Tax=Gopherus flavomarginatus TaxID=286002 RepID=UPI0021CC3AB5|nr:zona pellucida sperm-binding protein 3-like [Gopherus flavomarginatus]